MAFELYLSKRLHRKKQFADFVPFCSDAFSLPDCTTRVYEKDGDQHLYGAEGFVFRSYADEPGAIRVPGTSYYAVPWKNGVVLQNELDPTALVYIHPDFSRMDVIADTNEIGSSVLYDLLMCGYQFISAKAGALLMHASAVIYRGEAILFSGVSGAGKSTQANAWVKYYDAKPINYDHPCIVWQNNVPYACGTPWGGKEKFCQPVMAPVRAIVFIHGNDHSTVHELGKADAFSRLVLNNAMPHVCHVLDVKFLSTVKRLTESVPVYHQEGTLTREAPDTLHRVLWGET